MSNLWAKFRKYVIGMIGDVNNSLGSLLGKEKKFLQWAEENNCKIEKMEFSSFLEAGFSYWQVPRGHSCVKVILQDENNDRIGAYLMTGNGQPTSSMVIKKVPLNELNFKAAKPPENVS